MVQILGILNLTRDSFSDGGRYLEPGAAIGDGLDVAGGGADLVDVGAESTHPRAGAVPAEVEIARLEPVVRALRAAGVRVSVDTHKPQVIERMLALGVEMINDVTALADERSVAALRDGQARVAIMFARRRTPSPRAAAVDEPADGIVEEIGAFFRDRLRQLAAAGIAPARLVLGPGMGLFLGRDVRVSLRVLRDLHRLLELGRPLLVCTSRKGFIGELLGAADAARRAEAQEALAQAHTQVRAQAKIEAQAQPGSSACAGLMRPAGERGFGTLATELWAVQAGGQDNRKHDPAALRDALGLLGAVRG